MISFSYDRLLDSVKENSRILIADGNLSLLVKDIKKS